MSKKQKDQFLRFGQLILIKGFKNKNEPDIGFLTAKGFADAKANYQTYDDILFFQNYRNAIFQIIPASNFQINDELRKLRVAFEDDSVPNEQILNGKAKSQKEQFEFNERNKKRNKITFGSAVVFRHFDSGDFLSGTIVPSNGSNGAFSVQVSDNLSQAMIWKVQPFRSYEANGMPIPMQSPVRIKNQYNNGYLTFQKINANRQNDGNGMKNQPKIKEDKSYSFPVKENSMASSIYQAVTYFVDLSKQSEVEMPWEFQLHALDNQNDDLIQHDIVYLKHTENQGVLSTNNKNQIILKQLKNPDPTSSELNFYESLWQIQEEQSDGIYILRHLISGKTLGVEKTGDEHNKRPLKPKLVDICQGPRQQEDIGKIQIRLAKKGDTKINSKAFVNLCCDGYLMAASKKIELQGDKQKKQDEPFEQLYQRLYQQQINYYEREVQFNQKIAMHCFVIMEIQPQLQKELLFALSFHAKIINLRNDLKDYETAQSKVTYISMMRITEKIRQIKGFLKDCSVKDQNFQHKDPLKKRQNICKDLGISELLFQLLYYMKANEPHIFQKPQQANEKKKFNQMYNTCYQVIIELIKNNYLFKVHVTKWINFIINDVIESNVPQRSRALKEVLKNNSFYVDNFVKKELVERLANRMLDIKYNTKDNNLDFFQRKYIEIFRSFCLVGNRVNTENQQKVHKYMIRPMRQRDESKNYQITLKLEKDEIRCVAALEKSNLKQRSFNDYQKMCKEEFASAWLYFVEYLYLVGDLVQGRNKQVQKQMQALFSRDVLTALLKGNKYNLKQAEAPLIRIIHYLYIESKNYFPIARNKQVLSYEDITKEKIKINTATTNVAQYKPILEIMLNKLKERSVIIPEQIQKNEVLYQILNFFLETLNLGFYKTKQELQELLNAVYKILGPPKENPTPKDYTNWSKKTKENVLMMECKLKCLNIIHFIADFDMDLTIQNVCLKFKNFNVPMKSGLTFVQTDENSTNFARNFLEEFTKNREQPILSTKFSNSMIQLTQYENPELTAQAIAITKRIVQHVKLEMDQFSNRVLICDTEKIDLKQFVQDRQKKFQMLEDPNMIRIDETKQNDNYFLITQQAQFPLESGIMNDLHAISMLMKNQLTVKQVKNIDPPFNSVYNVLSSINLVNFTNQRKSSNLGKQQVVRATNIHKKVLAYILNCKEFPETMMAKKLLHMCYKFMVSLIENYQEIKMELLPYLKDMRHQIRKNLGCLDYLKEMYDNNKIMLFNESQLEALIKEICDIINTKPTNQEGDYYRCKLLDFFRYLIYYNGKALKTNQIKIMKIMQDEDYKNIDLNINLDLIKRLVSQFISDKVKASEGTKKDDNKVKMRGELTYVISYFQILISLIDDNNEVNIGKLVKRFPFKVLVEFIAESQRCWPLKRNIRAFLNRLYYLQPQLDSNTKVIVEQELRNIITDMDYFIEIKNKVNIAQIENYQFEMPVRFSYMESYLYLNLEQNLISLFKLVSGKNNIVLGQIINFLLNNLKDEKGRQGPYNFIKITQRLGCIRNYFVLNNNQYTSSLIRFIQGKFKDIISDFDDSIYEEGLKMCDVEQKGLKTKKDKENARNILISRIIQGGIDSFYVQENAYKKPLPLLFYLPAPFVPPSDKVQKTYEKLQKILRQMLTKEKRAFQNEDEKVLYKMEKLTSALKLSEDANDYYIQSMRQLATNFYDPIHMQSSIKYIKRIILLNRKDPEGIPSQLKRFFLKLISGLIESIPKNPNIGFKPIDEWEAQYYELQYGESIQQIQVKLKQAKLGDFLTDLLGEPIYDDVPLANSVLNCCIAYLLTGNSATQNDILQILRNQKGNKVFRNIELLISKLGDQIKKNVQGQTLVKQVKSEQFVPTFIDNYDFYEQREKYCTRKNVEQGSTTADQINKLQCFTTYRRAFRFLHLLCQNSNIEGKKFIRSQPGKINNVNFIGIAVKQLRGLFSAMHPSIKEIPSYLIGFLNEVTQIPVKENQQELMNSTFFEDLNQMQSRLARQQKQQVSFAFQSTSQLQPIYFQAVEMILSIFEGNQNQIYKLVDTKVGPNFLINILQAKLKQMSITTKDEMINYISENTVRINQETGQKEAVSQFNEDLMMIFSVIIVFKKLDKKYEDIRKKEQITSRILQSYIEVKKSNPELYDYLERSLLQIEITDDQKKNQTIFFPRFPVFNSLSGNLRDYIMQKVGRDTHRDKIVYLLGYVQGITNCIKYSYELETIEKISQGDINSSYKLASTISVIICVYMLLFYNVIVQFGSSEYISARLVNLGGFALSLSQLSMSCAFAYYWYRMRSWIKPKSKLDQSKKDQTSQATPKEEKQQEQPNWLKAKLSYYISPIKVGIWDPLREKLFSEQSTQLLTSPEFIRIVLYVLISLAGTFYDSKWFFVHLIDIFCQHPLMSSMIVAISLNIRQLYYVCLMGVVFTFVFCAVTFSNYMPDVYPDQTDTEGMCDNLLDCIMKLYVSGAIEQTMQKFQMLRYTFDMIHFVFFGILFDSIVSSIILDAFGALRQKNENIDSDKKNFCYICNISREKLDKMQPRVIFTDHTRKKHFLWNYIFYIYLLNVTSNSNYSGLQSQISKKYHKKPDQADVSWVPNDDEGQFSLPDTLKDLIKEIQTNQNSAKQKKEKISEDIASFNEEIEKYEGVL